MKPLIFFSYGMMKTGSTLAFELARSSLVLSGCDQPRLSTAAVEDRKKLNFITHVDRDQAMALRAETMRLGHTIAIKTHTRPDPEIVEMLQAGEAFGHAVYRDPREIALSMIDHGARSRSNGRPAFAEYTHPLQCIDNIRHQTNTLLAWLSLPGIVPLFYDDFAFSPQLSAQDIGNQLGTSADAAKVAHMATRQRFTQFNKGVARRADTEMDAQTSAVFAAAFAPLYDRLIRDRAALPRDGRPVLDPSFPLCDWSVAIPSLTGEPT